MRLYHISRGVLLLATIPSARGISPGVASFVVPTAFPSSVFSSYYVQAAPTSEPQPAIFDPILNITYSQNLTDSRNVPTDEDDPLYFPTPIANLTKEDSEGLVKSMLCEIKRLIYDVEDLSGNCSKCINALRIGQLVAQFAPTYLPDAMVSLCQVTGFASDSWCESTYTARNLGAIWTQTLALADVGGLDGRYICNFLSPTYCATPTTSPLNITGLFPKQKPLNLTPPKASGKRVKVLHISDFHLDPRYQVASEVKCASGMCCRHSGDDTNPKIAFPAPLYGAYKCDTPYYLALAALQSIAVLTGTGNTHSSPAWTLYTGDIVSHDQNNQMSHDYVTYVETSIFDMMKSYISGPVYAVLGNHDTTPVSIDGPYSLPGPLGQQYSWNYDHVSSLWEYEGWMNALEARQAAIHYSAYSVKNEHGLRIITMNTDFWYKSNILNYINTTNPDVSGTLKFLIEELQCAEDAGERVWILGHVLSGWDGSNPLPNPTDLFYQIIDRYSPHVIANVFFGHTHEDQLMIYYANNGTLRNRNTAQTLGWVGPSITPLTNLNAGYRMYEVDTGSFDIYEAYTFYSDVSKYPTLNSTGPTFEIEYSTRQAYANAVSWPETAPLNATFWHDVTVAMESNRTLVTTFNTYQGKSSCRSPNCTSDACTAAKICYIRSGSAPLGRMCPRGFASVQSPYTGIDF